MLDANCKLDHDTMTQVSVQEFWEKEHILIDSFKIKLWHNWGYLELV